MVRSVPDPPGSSQQASTATAGQINGRGTVLISGSGVELYVAGCGVGGEQLKEGRSLLGQYGAVLSRQHLQRPDDQGGRPCGRG